MVQSIGDVLAKQLKAAHAAAPVVGDGIMRLPLREDQTPADADCPLCHGVGHYRLDLPVGHPRFGKLFECECVAANRAAYNTGRLHKSVGLLEADLGLSWDGLVANDALGPAIAAVRRVMLRGWGWVYLSGDYGTGKTALLKTATAEAMRAGLGSVYTLLPELLRHLRGGVAAKNYDERLEAWRDVRVLCLDEMGRENDTPWTRESEVLIFEPRYQAALVEQKTITIFASNFSRADMPEWLASRMADGRFEVVEVRGPDWRPAMS